MARWSRLLSTLAVGAGLLLEGRAPASMHAGTARAATLIAVPVAVPAGMRAAPFDVARTLSVPPGFSVAVYARVPGARFMAITPAGDLLVSVPGAGKIVLVQPGGGEPRVSDFATGLDNPQGLAFHAAGSTRYLYVGEQGQIARTAWRAGVARAGTWQVIVPHLPYGPTADGDAHPLKDLAFGPDGALYVGIGSSCNACTGDGVSNPVRGAIYRYDADGHGSLFARGLRNPEGLAFVPGTATLWAAVNERDQIAYPFADASGRYGQVFAAYVDNHPPDELTAVQQGANYGWPYCDPDPDTAAGYDTMPFDPDYQFNRRGAAVDCATMHRVSKGIPAHSAPLGLTFLQGTSAPAQYRAGAVVALHGSWDRSGKTGYKVVYFPWVRDGGTGHPGAQQDLVTGWLPRADADEWDRPVDLVVDPHGALLISDDASGTIYKLTYRG